jgi:ethanolamine utilization protein EutA
LKNLPVVLLDTEAQREDLSRQISRKLASQETTAVLAFSGLVSADYTGLQKMAEAIANGIPEGPVYLCLEQDMAKALGQILALRMAGDRPILCIDRVRMAGESYLDIGEPVGPALPVVVKTLVLER